MPMIESFRSSYPDAILASGFYWLSSSNVRVCDVIILLFATARIYTNPPGVVVVSIIVGSTVDAFIVSDL